jgi:hypothetical protein
MKQIFPLLLFFILLLAASCGNSKPDENKHILTSENDTAGIADSYSGKNDTLHISEPLIVMTWPDSLMMEQLKSKDSDAFYITADDYSYYNSELMQLADSLGIRNISTSLKYLQFALPGGKHWMLDRSPEESWWGVYVYNGSDTPSVYSAIDDNRTYLKNYFKK